MHEYVPVGACGRKEEVARRLAAEHRRLHSKVIAKFTASLESPCIWNYYSFDGVTPRILWVTPYDLERTALLICERLFGSKAFKSIRLVGLQISLRLGSFVESLIGCCNRVKWLIRTWFPATELRLVNAFAWLAERTSANSTKNFERAGIAFIPLLIIAFQIIFKKRSQFLICLCNLAQNWVW